MKTQQAEAHADSLPETVGRVAGSIARWFETRLDAGDADYRAGYQASRDAGHSHVRAAFNGMLRRFEGNAQRESQELSQIRDSVAKGFKAGHGADPTTIKKQRFDVPT